jgi:biotin carboxyl carrier protein
MRTYLIDEDNNEVLIDLVKTIKHSSNHVEFKYLALEEREVVEEKNLHLKKLAGSYFISTDLVAWKKLARQDVPSKLLNVDKVFRVYRGFKPSGLSGGDEGALVTQMPGKIVKINVEVGQEVEKGQTLLILEAMKMENEIKSGMDGVIKAIHINEGDALESGVLMMEVE